MKQLLRKFEKFKLHHVAFWSAYLSFWIIVSTNPDVPIEAIIIINVVYAVTNIGASYVSIYSLLPLFLDKKRYFMFVILQLLNLSWFSLWIALMFHFLLKDNPAAYKQMMQWSQILPATLGSIGTTVFLVTMIKMVRQRIKNEELRKELEVEKYVTELNFLKSQINPHFLFNALNNIYYLIKKNPEQAAEAVLRFSELMRFQLYETQKDTVSIVEEIDHLQDYINLERLRKSDKIEIETEFDLKENLSISPLLLVPLVENAFKYVNLNQAQEHYIRISLAINESVLTFKVANSYVYAISNEKSSGIGLVNLRRRLELLYPGKHKLVIKPLNGVFETELTIKLN